MASSWCIAWRETKVPRANSVLVSPGRWAAGGVSIATEPFDGPFGRTFAVADPDGYVITLHDGA